MQNNEVICYWCHANIARSDADLVGVDILGQDMWWCGCEQDKKQIRKGLVVNVYRTLAHSDSSNNGVTARQNRALLVGEGIPQIFEAKGLIILELVKSSFGEVQRLYAKLQGETRHSMFGGNFIYTSDGRFPCGYPIPVHDRIEEN